MLTWDEAERRARSIGPAFKNWKPSQRDANERWQSLNSLLLFFPTGEGKTLTSLALAGQRADAVQIIAPPKLQPKWKQDAANMGLTIDRIMSVDIFRRQGTKMSTKLPLIIDEIHKLGGHGAVGFKRFRSFSAATRAEIIGASATPNWNDAERVYTMLVAFGKQPGPYLDWLYANCVVQSNPFTVYPDVLGFKNYSNAIEFLRDQDFVAYVEDKARWTADEMLLPSQDLDLFERYGLRERDHRIVNSRMEKDHARVNLNFISDSGLLRVEIVKELSATFNYHSDRDKWIIFCSHKTVAQAAFATFRVFAGENVWLIDGGDTNIEEYKQEFISASGPSYLIATSALAEGVDGLDKHCHSMILLDDIVGDHAKRRQLIGRILPRGAGDDAERLVITARF